MSIATSPGEATVAAPAGCPFCKSEKVVTTSKALTVATYWRCETCGQIWNPSRLDDRPYRRKW